MLENFVLLFVSSLILGNHFAEFHTHLRHLDLHGTPDLASSAGEAGIYDGSCCLQTAGDLSCPHRSDAGEIFVAEIAGSYRKDGALIQTSSASQAIECLP